MEQPTPDWFSKKFFTQCLQHEKNNKDIVVTNLTTSPAAPAGNNYGSDIIRVKVDYKNCPNDAETQSISLIVKSELTTGPIKDMHKNLEAVGAEEKETVFYNRFLPKVKTLTEPNFAPKNLYSPLGNVIILEDLKEQGFTMADRMKLLDFDHCRLYMEAAASFHAASYAIHKESPEMIESLGKELDLKGVEIMFSNMITLGLKCFADETRKIEKYKKYCKLVEDISGDLGLMVQRAQKPGKTLNTLIQGDPWTTNMMFRYDSSGTVREVKLLDFQCVRYSCPLNDIVFFLWSSAQHDVRRNKLDDLYKLYLHAFNKKLEELKCTERMTFEDLKERVLEKSPFALHIAGAFLPFFMDSSPIDFGVIAKYENGNKNPYERVYGGVYRTNTFPKLLEELELCGVFDYLEKIMNPDLKE